MRPLASCQRSHAQILPRPSWVEHDPLEIVARVNECVAGALDSAAAVGVTPEVHCVGLTNQRETTVVWDSRTGRPLHNAIVWLDGRTKDTVHGLVRRFGNKEHFAAATGLPLSTYFSGVKLRWLLDNVPAVAEAAAAGTCMAGTVDSWLLYSLTGGPRGGVHATDATNASRTLLMDLATLTWHEPALDALAIPRSLLPRIASNAERYGLIATGPLKGVPITGCLGDQQAAMLGQRCRPGEAKNTYGTGCFLLLNTGPVAVPSSHGLLTTLAHQLGPNAAPHYALEGSIAIAGAGVEWLRNNLGLISSASEIESLASSVPDTAGVVFVPAFSGLLAPHWRDDARGVICGLTQFTTRAHVARALLEAVCFQTKEVLEAMQADAGCSLSLLRADGGASANGLLMQLQADILGVRVLRPHHVETTALGAALAAAHGAGLMTTEAIFSDHGETETELGGGGHLGATAFAPTTCEGERALRFAAWKRALARSMDWA